MASTTMNSEDSTAERPSPPKRLQISKRYPGLCALPQRRGIPKTILKPDTTIGSSLLERLPPEIRNIIYELVLIDPDYALRVRSRHAELSDRADAGVARHALTRVSRAIRSECLRMWYERNVFAFRSLLDVEVWIRIIADAGKWLRKVVLAEGAVEGRPRGLSALLSRDATPREAGNRTRFTCTIFPAADKAASFEAQGVIHPEILATAMRKLKPIAALLTGKVDAEMVIEGLVPHCTICEPGPLWSCGGYEWWRD